MRRLPENAQAPMLAFGSDSGRFAAVLAPERLGQIAEMADHTYKSARVGGKPEAPGARLEAKVWKMANAPRSKPMEHRAK